MANNKTSVNSVSNDKSVSIEKKYAPIVVFAFNRPNHLKQTLEALKNNNLARQSGLYIYCDHARDDVDVKKVKDVIAISKSVKGFASVEVIERENNYGLAKNIISGVTDVVSKYERVIVLEDDILTSPLFLEFMNNALEKYKNEKNIWHISGWNYPIDMPDVEGAFLWRVMNCWGWGTWRDRWNHFQKNPERLIKQWSRKKIKRFNIDGAHNYWSQVIGNYKSKIDTWAIFWYATIFENNGLCLNPEKSYTKNIGMDGSGENCTKIAIYDKEELNQTISEFPKCIKENKNAVLHVKRFFKKNESIKARIRRHVMNLIE